MPQTTTSKAFVNYVVELMQVVGAVTAKSMFGGHGLFLDGLMFGVIANDVLYLKADKLTQDEFINKGLEAFSYQKNGKQFNMSYYQAP